MAFGKKTGTASAGDVVNRKFKLFAADYTLQEPTVLDTPLRVKFGDAQDVDFFSLATDGLITCKVGGTYDLRFTGQSARGGVGGTSWLYLRALVNGTQVFQSLLAKVASSNEDRPIQAELTVTLLLNDEVEFQVIRGSEGVNDGYLEAIATPAYGGNSVASASLAISQNEIG